MGEPMMTLEALTGVPSHSKKRTLGLGILPIRRCMREYRMMRGLVARISRTRPDVEIVVIGSTPDDLELMRAGAVVTGPIEPDELSRCAQLYGLDRILVCAAGSIQGHPMLEAAMQSLLPVARHLGGVEQTTPADVPDMISGASAFAEQRAALLLPWPETGEAA